ncbi:MAG: DUF2852 domain-containing protein [Rhodobiaceae bacterium]|nr:DUF2852 domain-containing protein [Rhodobiaceae bacterium]
MELVSRIDDYGKPAWIILMILGFVVFWPVGLALLFYLIWSGRMGCRKHGPAGRWHFEEKARQFAGRNFSKFRMAPSGNSAFDEYREETLKRLEREHEEFRDFLQQLRHARDKAEFDQFMADRRKKDDAEDAPDGPPRSGGEADRGDQPAA